MAMMQELLKRPGCPPSADGYQCENRLRNQFLEYHDRSAWYGEVYRYDKDGNLTGGLEGRRFLPGASTLFGVRDEYIADIIARLEAGELSPEEVALLYAAAEAAGGKAAEGARRTGCYSPSCQCREAGGWFFAAGGPTTGQLSRYAPRRGCGGIERAGFTASGAIIRRRSTRRDPGLCSPDWATRRSCSYSG